MVMMARREIAEIIISPAYYHGDGKSALATHRPLGPAIPPAVYVPSPAQLGAATEQPLHKSLAKTHSLPIEEGITRPRDISRTPQHFPPQAYAAELSGPSNRDRGVVREPPCAENESVKTVATTSSGAARKEDRTRGGSWAEHASLMSTGNHPQVISIVHKEPVDYEPDDGHGDDGDSALSLIVSFRLCRRRRCLEEKHARILANLVTGPLFPACASLLHPRGHLRSHRATDSRSHLPSPSLHTTLGSRRDNVPRPAVQPAITSLAHLRADRRDSQPTSAPKVHTNTSNRRRTTHNVYARVWQ